MTIAMQPIYTQTVGSGGAASITFNNIPQYFTDLKIEVSARGVSNPNAIQADLFVVYLNNDSSALYSYTQAYGNGGSTYSNRASAQNAVVLGSVPTSGATASTFGNTSYYIPNYSGTISKQIIVDSVSESNVAIIANQGQTLSAGLYRNTTGITSIQFFSTGGNFAANSTFTLYGITKG